MSDAPRGSADRAAGQRQWRELLHEQRRDTLSDMCAALAGRLNTPLRGVLSFADSLLRRGASDAQRADLESLQADARRGAAIVAQLLALSRDTGMQRSPVTAAQLFGHVAVAVGDRRRRERVEVLERVEPGAPDIAGDGGRLQRALDAIVCNALDAIAEYRGRGTVRLSAATTADGVVRLAVADDGPGMSPFLIARAAEPFFTTKETGLGLGLTLARVVALEHQGELRIASTLGVGTTVSLELPAWTGRGRLHIDSPPPANTRPRTALLALNDPDAVAELADACDLLRWKYHVAVNVDDALLLAGRGGYDAAIVATGLLAGAEPLADLVERQRGLKGRVVRLQLPDGPSASGAIPMPGAPESLAVALGLALAGQAGAGGW